MVMKYDVLTFRIVDVGEFKEVNSHNCFFLVRFRGNHGGGI